MRGWVDIASLRHAKRRDEGLVARGATSLSSLFSEGLSLALVPPVVDAPRNVTVSAVYERSDEEVVVYFEEVSDSACAEALSGCHCLAREEDVDQKALEADTILPDWEGWKVFDAQAGYIGEVACIEERAIQPLLVVNREEGNDALIPLVDEFVDGIDEVARHIHLSLPNGLLEL